MAKKKCQYEEAFDAFMYELTGIKNDVKLLRDRAYESGKWSVYEALSKVYTSIENAETSMCAKLEYELTGFHPFDE